MSGMQLGRHHVICAVAAASEAHAASLGPQRHQWVHAAIEARAGAAAPEPPSAGALHVASQQPVGSGARCFLDLTARFGVRLQISAVVVHNELVYAVNDAAS